MVANNDIDHQIDTLFSTFRQTIPIESLSATTTSNRINVQEVWLLETLDLLRFLHAMNQQYVYEYNSAKIDDDRNSPAAQKSKEMKRQIELAYSMLAKAESTSPYHSMAALQQQPPTTTDDIARVVRRAAATTVAVAADEDIDDEYFLDPTFHQNMNTLLHAIRNYTDKTCIKFQRWLDEHPSSARSSVEEKDLIYGIFLAPENDDGDEIGKYGDGPRIQTSESGMERESHTDGSGDENAVLSEASIPRSIQNQPRQALLSHSPSKNVAMIDPIQFQKQQQELLEEELASMASRLKSTTLAMNATLQSQTKDLDSMEQLAQSNLDQVTHTTKDVEGRLKKRGWKKQFATWSLIGTVVGMWVICFMVMRTAPKRIIGKGQVFRRREGGDKKQQRIWANGVWRKYFLSNTLSSKFDEEKVLNNGAKQVQQQKERQSMSQECEILSNGTQICTGAERWREDREEDAARLDYEREEAERKRMEDDEEEAAYEREVAGRKRMEDDEEEAARLEQERAVTERRRAQQEEEEAARLDKERKVAERKRMEEEEEEEEKQAARLEQERALTEQRRAQVEEATRLEQERKVAERKRMEEKEEVVARLEQERAVTEQRRVQEEEEDAVRLEQESEVEECERKEEEEEDDDATRTELKQVETETAWLVNERVNDTQQFEPERFISDKLTVAEDTMVNAESEVVQSIAAKDVHTSDAPIFTPADVRIAAARAENDLLARYISVSPEMIDASDRGGWRPIHEAVRAGNLAGVQLLIVAGCDLTSRTGRNANGGTALWWAVQRFGEEHSIVQLLRSHGALEAGPTK